MTSNGETWKISLSCTRAEAEAATADDDVLAILPVLLAREPDPAQPESWRLEAYVESEPDPAVIAALTRLAPSAAESQPTIEHLPAEDWLTLSQAGLEPVRAGRFFIHTAAHADEAPKHSISLQIEASRAFGTGQHETTVGCLLMLDALKAMGGRFKSVADIGTGTGLLAFAAHRLWPAARIIASDIDPVAIEITRENAAFNQVALAARPGAVQLVTAPGLLHGTIRRSMPYDLIIANILAGPLIALAPSFGAALAPGGTIILAGLLVGQADAVAEAYRRHGFRLAETITRGEWPTLRLVKRRSSLKRRG